MHVDNPDPPMALPPDEPDDNETMQIDVRLFSDALRELDPIPVVTIFGQVRWLVARVRAELEKPAVGQDEIEAVGGLLTDILNEVDQYRQRLTYPFDVSRGFVKALTSELGAGLDGCDHSVGICMCGTIGLHTELKLALEGKLTCPQCGGAGFIWDPDVEKAEIDKAIAAGQDPDEVHYALDGWAGNVACPKCGGYGVVRLEEMK